MVQSGVGGYPPQLPYCLPLSLSLYVSPEGQVFLSRIGDCTTGTLQRLGDLDHHMVNPVVIL